MHPEKKYPIGVFDSGYGGLTVLKEFVKKMPDYDFIYLGDNARAPYGNRSFETVYAYTLECVKQLFSMGCRLVILACNTASAKALRNIQQNDLPHLGADRRVLGVIRPTAEIVGKITKTNHVGVFATTGTVTSQSYTIEIDKLFPHIKVFQQACSMWVPIVENNEINTPGADYFIKKNITQLLTQSNQIDTIILGCTHYPLLLEEIKKYISEKITIVSQGEIVANSLLNYLARHPEINMLCSRENTVKFFTTDSAQNFDAHAANFFGKKIQSNFIEL